MGVSLIGYAELKDDKVYYSVNNDDEVSTYDLKVVYSDGSSRSFNGRWVGAYTSEECSLFWDTPNDDFWKRRAKPVKLILVSYNYHGSCLIDTTVNQEVRIWD